MSDESEVLELLHSIDKKVVGLEIKMEQVSKSYVTRGEFEPVQRIVYGLVGAVLLTVVGAVIALVVT